jgi:hypothetical protein
VTRFLIALIVSLPLAAHAQAPMLTPLMPSPQYDHPYAGPVQVGSVSEETLRAICGIWEPHECARVMPDKTCLIVIVDGTSPDLKAKFIVHGTAHCKGWPADHPGGTRR